MIQPLETWSSEHTLRTFYTGMYRCNVRGREMQKCGDDLDRYTEVIAASNPDLIIETGTRFGGSAVWFHTEFDLPVITVDISHAQLLPGSQERYPGIDFMVGSSTHPSLISELKEKIGGRQVLVSLDSDHHAPHVWEEIQAYGQLVKPGGYMVVEDACFDMWEGEDSARGGVHIPQMGGPLKAINLAALDRHPWWERDTEIEGWTNTSHSPCGWWKRRG